MRSHSTPQRLLLLLLLLLASSLALAGTLGRDDLARRFPAPLTVGERAADLPAWPLFKQNGTTTQLVGYVFESADLAPIPGFAGVPINLLVAIDPQGVFLDVPCCRSTSRCSSTASAKRRCWPSWPSTRALSLGQSIEVGGAGRRQPGAARRRGQGHRLGAHPQPERAVGGLAGGARQTRLCRRARPEPHRRASARDAVRADGLRALQAAGLLAHLRVLNRDVEALFAGSAGAGLDAQALAQPDAVFIDLYLAWASVPSAGRNLLDAPSWRRLSKRLEPGDHALLVAEQRPPRHPGRGVRARQRAGRDRAAPGPAAARTARPRSRLKLAPPALQRCR